MKRALLLNVVVRQSAAVFELLSGKDETLLIGRNALLVLDLGLDVVNRVRGLNVEGDRLAGQGFHENLPNTRRNGRRVSTSEVATQSTQTGWPPWSTFSLPSLYLTKKRHRRMPQTRFCRMGGHQRQGKRLQRFNRTGRYTQTWNDFLTRAAVRIGSVSQVLPVHERCIQRRGFPGVF